MPGRVAGTAAAGLYPKDQMRTKLLGIYGRVLEILKAADAEGRTPHEVAYRMAAELLARDGR